MAFEETVPGGHIPELHVEENEADGVWGSVLYPSIGSMVYTLEHSVLTAAVRAYNDWIAEFVAVAPDRLKGVAVLNVDDVDEAIAELHRALGLGLTSITLPVTPMVGYDDPVYDPLWAVAEGLGLPVSFHTGTIRDQSAASKMRGTRWASSVSHRFIQEALAQLIFGAVFERFPRLQVVSVEFELGWAPHLLERMDFAYLQRRHWNGQLVFADGMTPSDFFHRNVLVSFQEDPVGIELRHHFRTENLLWGNDYPHSESTYPRSRSIVDALLTDLTPEERTAVTCTNTARLYGFDVPA
jgi:predicted TIM-barrel fold metal-dependent hydrolase